MPKDNGLSKKKRLILVVDDERIVRDTVQLMLEDLGYDVITAVDGEDSVQVYEEKGSDISLVILDMVMPNLNGIEAFYKIISINPQAKIILASGFTSIDESIMQQMYKNGLKLFMKKPYLQNELGRILSAIFKD